MNNKHCQMSRPCPDCGNIIHYKYESAFYRARKEHRVCNNCRYKKYPPSNKGIPMNSELRVKISNSLKGKSAWNKGIPMTDETKKKLSYSLKNLPIKMSSWHIGKKTPSNVIAKMQQSHIGKPSPMKGRRHTDDTRSKIRQAILKGIKSKGISHKSNPVACRFIDNLNATRNWNLQHAGNGGEVEVYGYLLDGYDNDKNIVFEYDEPRHHLMSKKKNDIRRQNDIFKYFKMIGKSISFWRYDERYNNLYEVYPI